MRFILYVLLPIFSLSNCYSQNCITYTGAFTNEEISVIIDEINRSIQTHIYYKREWVIGEKFSGKFDHECIEEILSELLKNKSQILFIEKDGYYFLTGKQRIIALDVPASNIEQAKNASLDSNFSLQSDFTSKNEDQEKLLELGNKSQMNLSRNVTLKGKIIDTNTNEPLSGVLVWNMTNQKFSITNDIGNYILEIPVGTAIKVATDFYGKKRIEKSVIVYTSSTLNLEMEDEIVSLNEVIISTDKDDVIQGIAGLNSISTKQIRALPAPLGEADVIRTALTLPGVSSIGEVSYGFNVRGGSVDQNLVLYNGAPIFNTAHFFGFFSVFNPDVISETNLYKGYIPPQYGGRLSSVLDVSSALPNHEFSGRGGISPVSARIKFDVPVSKKLLTSFSIRSTYSNWILNKVDDKEVKNSNPRFSDFSGDILYKTNNGSQLRLSGYVSNDRFNILSDSTINYQNHLISLNYSVNRETWSGSFNSSFSKYNYNLESSKNPKQAFNYFYNIKEIDNSLNVLTEPNSSHALSFGIDTKFYLVNPGGISPIGTLSTISDEQIEKEKALEAAIYLTDEFEISPKLSFNVGLRYSFYSFLGSNTSLVYADDVPRSRSSIIDTVKSTGVIQNYSGPEFRLSTKYLLNDNASFKASYSRSRQYIGILSNTTAISPIDTWKLSDEYIKPQVADQISIGYFRNMLRGLLDVSFEVYLKSMKNLIDFKVGSDLILNSAIEADVLQGIGKSYGIEIWLKKTVGHFNGSLALTYSRSLLKLDGADVTSQINSGQYFPVNYDKPFDLTFNSSYRLNGRVSVNLGINFSSGRPITIPNGQYQLGGVKLVQYSNRNAFRTPNYFRTDIGMNIEGNYKTKKKIHGSWNLSIYNLTGRDNIYSLFFRNEETIVRSYKLTVFDRPIPTITYNFKF